MRAETARERGCSWPRSVLFLAQLTGGNEHHSQAFLLRDLVLYLYQHVIVLVGARLLGVQAHGHIKPVILAPYLVFHQFQDDTLDRVVLQVGTDAGGNFRRRKKAPALKGRATRNGRPFIKCLRGYRERSR